jgi:hypothetical protein
MRTLGQGSVMCWLLLWSADTAACTALPFSSTCCRALMPCRLQHHYMLCSWPTSLLVRILCKFESLFLSCSV